MPRSKRKKNDDALGFTLDDLDLGDSDELMADVAYTGDVEVDSITEMETLRTAFATRTRREYHRRHNATDSEHWLCLVFQSREQMLEFQEKAGWGTAQDKYLDGRIIAELLGIMLTADVPPPSRITIDPKVAALAMEESELDMLTYTRAYFP